MCYWLFLPLRSEFLINKGLSLMRPPRGVARVGFSMPRMTRFYREC
jgi:hypothetical protein